MSEEPRKDAMLSYAPAAPRRRRQRLYRALLVAIAVAACGLAAWKILPEAYRRLSMLTAQRRLINAHTPQVEAYALTLPPLSRAEIPPSMFGLGEGVVTTRGTDINLDHFLASCQSPLPLSYCTIYAHSISDRHGNELIVTVHVPLGQPEYDPCLSVDVLKPGTLFRYPSPAQVVVRPFQFENIVKGPPYPPLSFKVFTGQPDPTDASHFTIDYELNGQRHVLDGYIDDQNVLRIEKRKESTSLGAMDSR